MKEFRFSKFGLPSVLRIEEIPRPEPHDGEALVKVKAAAINPSDVKNVAGLFSGTTLPRTPGRDFSGVIGGSICRAERSANMNHLETGTDDHRAQFQRGVTKSNVFPGHFVTWFSSFCVVNEFFEPSPGPSNQQFSQFLV
jgi:alcohol dehydrogenase-like protein